MGYPLTDVPFFDYKYLSLCETRSNIIMDTKPIFDFIKEIEERNKYVYPKEMSFAERHVIGRYYVLYHRILSQMEKEFEACVFQCVAENPLFKEELPVVANKLVSSVKEWKRKQGKKILGKPPYGDSKRVAIKVADVALLFLRNNYGVVGIDLTDSPLPQEQEHPTTLSLNVKELEPSKLIRGIKGLADYFDCSVSTAQAISNDGVLQNAGIQYRVGKDWRFNREKLDKYIAENPDLFARIRCKK